MSAKSKPEVKLTAKEEKKEAKNSVVIEDEDEVEYAPPPPCGDTVEGSALCNFSLYVGYGNIF